MTSRHQGDDPSQHDEPRRLYPASEERPPAFTLHFTESTIVEDRLVVVTLTLDAGDTEAHAGTLLMSLAEWDRVWRAFVNSTAAFNAQGIDLQRTHGKDRF